jgi:hypothetical protein
VCFIGTSDIDIFVCGACFLTRLLCIEKAGVKRSMNDKEISTFHALFYGRLEK